MSRRYGRNQKRRAREALAIVQATAERALSDAERYRSAQEMAEGLLKHNSMLRKSLQDQLDDAKEYLQAFSAVLPPQTFKLDGEARHGFRMPVVEPLSLDFGCDVFTSTAMLQTVHLETLLAKVDLDRLRQHMHCNAYFAGVQMAYSADLQTLRTMPPRQLVEHMARSLAVQIEQRMREKGIR